MFARASQIPMNFPHAASMAREDFLVSDCNREALAWIDRWPYWNAPALYIYGPEGSGKTHLANIWKSQINPKGEVVEDIERKLGNRTEEEGLFHLYNRVRQTPGSFLVTGTKPLALQNFAIPDLASRLKSCPQVALGAPDEDLLRLILVKLFSDRQMRIDAGVIEYCLPRMERSFQVARYLVEKLDERSMVEKRPVSTAMARAILNPEQPDLAF